MLARHSLVIAPMLRTSLCHLSSPTIGLHGVSRNCTAGTAGNPAFPRPAHSPDRDKPALVANQDSLVRGNPPGNLAQDKPLRPALPDRDRPRRRKPDKLSHRNPDISPDIFSLRPDTVCRDNGDQDAISFYLEPRDGLRLRPVYHGESGDQARASVCKPGQHVAGSRLHARSVALECGGQLVASRAVRSWLVGPGFSSCAA